MPTYDYQCPKCNEVVKDIKVKLKDLDKTVVMCPICNAVTKRVIGTPLVVFKGVGWAKDGYDRSGQKPKGE